MAPLFFLMLWFGVSAPSSSSSSSFSASSSYAAAAAAPSPPSCPIDYASYVSDFFPTACHGLSAASDDCCAAAFLTFGLGFAIRLRETGVFQLPDEATVEACLAAFSRALDLGFSIAAAGCPKFAEPAMFVTGPSLCAGIESAQDWAREVGSTAMDASCKGDLSAAAACQVCNQDAGAAIAKATNLSSSFASSNNSNSDNSSACFYFGVLYAAAIVNDFGPTNAATAACLLAAKSTAPAAADKPHRIAVYASIGAAIVLFLGCLAALLLWLCCLRRRHLYHREFVDNSRKLLQGSMMRPNVGAVWYKLDELRAATDDFSDANLVAVGGFSTVYRGSMPDGSAVAVKRLRNCSPDGDAEFRNEVEVINSVRHKNLLPLRGCCVGSSPSLGHMRLLVYDYMPNGSLEDYLMLGPSPPMPIAPIPAETNETKTKTKTKTKTMKKKKTEKKMEMMMMMMEKKTEKKRLDWVARRRIALDAARGIAYLHNGVQPAIIHRDIKANNILLDHQLNALVADFGLAKVSTVAAADGMTHMTTRVAGTQGYLAPEYALYGQLTEKSDVYSFGVLLLVLLSGRPALDVRAEYPLITDWAWIMVKQGNPLGILDPDLLLDLDHNNTSNNNNNSASNDGGSNNGSISSISNNIEAIRNEMERFVLVGILCAHLLVAFRPTMTQALKMLQGDADIPLIPDRPLPLTHDMILADDATSSFCSLPSTSVDQCSFNTEDLLR